GAGEGALLPDELYTAAGASIGDAWAADVVVKVAPPTTDEVSRLHSGQTLIGFLAPRNAENSIGALKAAGVQAFALEAIPRISRAQVMDALSSQANVSGYKAVLLAASESTRFFPMLTTAAGTVKPATVLVLGVGVAGLQALATAKRLGGRTTGYDVRPEVADQVRSVGAQWLDVGIDAAGVTAFAVESIPRISRAQSMDALSSQANVAGYKSVLLAADQSTRFFPMLTTAAGTVKPATVLVLGVGVAGLQALATAKRLGARTTGYDVRPDVADQVRSLGAQWLDLGIEAAGEGGYARELSEDERAEQQKRLEEAITGFDVVITTALVPGRKAPTLVTAAAVQGMKAGSVVVDLAGEAGGNCELTEPGEIVVKHDVTIASPLNLPATMPEHASELYSRNISALLELMINDEGGLAPDYSDEVLSKSRVAGKPSEGGN
ncbi:MAG: H+-translocating transhydrogenase subunit alpha, partial [Pseudonocardiales bacterium]|nr:H+-translocating transhydrogenase subunit alpha [Pseudonocardiales bacterium]